ncbi:hypothetical protein ACPUEN_15155 [Algoriphagus yeomjeoni]|uniref:hypothetical protein n=1 Tax=Algoriphagus yeomjeoni TaxID=291403 RepID=UPI003CE50842
MEKVRSVSQISINEQTNEIYGLTTDEDPGVAVISIAENLMKTYKLLKRRHTSIGF